MSLQCLVKPASSKVAFLEWHKRFIFLLIKFKQKMKIVFSGTGC
jgi:hypothetical protein